MINYNKNKLINKLLDEYYETFRHTLDTAEFVPDKFNEKILKYIYKNMKKAFKQIDIEDRQYQRKLKEHNKPKIKHSIFSFLKKDKPTRESKKKSD